MTNAHRGSIVLLVLCFAVGSSIASALAAQEQDLKESERIATELIRNVKVWIGKSGTVEAKAADSLARFVIDDSTIPLIWVQQDLKGSGYEIRTTRQLQLVLTYLADTDAIAFRQPQYLICKQGYDQYLHDVYRDNTKSALEGRQLKQVNAPEVFSATSSALCRKFGKLFPIPKELRLGRDAVANNALLFFYFHELGHISKHHQLPDATAVFSAKSKVAKDRAFLDYMKRSRQQENQADEWSVDQLIEMGLQPEHLFNLPLFGILLASTGIDCAMESISTHPFAISRMISILSRVEKSANVKYKRESPKEIKTLINDFQAFGQKVSEKLVCK